MEIFIDKQSEATCQNIEKSEYLFLMIVLIEL